MGSAITYFRRYTLSAMLGLVTDLDTDAAGEVVKLPTPTQKQWAGIVKKFTEGEVDQAKIKENFTLTEQQENELNNL